MELSAVHAKETHDMEFEKAWSDGIFNWQILYCPVCGYRKQECTNRRRAIKLDYGAAMRPEDKITAIKIYKEEGKVKGDEFVASFPAHHFSANGIGNLELNILP